MDHLIGEVEKRLFTATSFDGCTITAQVVSDDMVSAKPAASVTSTKSFHSY